MLLEFLQAKIHRATVTDSCLHYQGSIGVDGDLIAQAGMHSNQRIQVLNVTNGERFETYLIPAPAGSKSVIINGAAARLAQRGDVVILCTYCLLDKSEAEQHYPNILLLDEQNCIQPTQPLRSRHDRAAQRHPGRLE